MFNTPTQLAARSGRPAGGSATRPPTIRSTRASMGSTRPGWRSIAPGSCTPGRSLSAGAEQDADRDRQGREVAFLAYTEMTNGIPLPHPWSVNIASSPSQHAARLARDRGAQVVIVIFDWGHEFVSTPSAFQLQLAEALTEGPGHHSDRRPARPRCAADRAGQREARRVRRGADPLQPGRIMTPHSRPRTGCSCSSTSPRPASTPG